mgnify:CR=1 FL=1
MVQVIAAGVGSAAGEGRDCLCGFRVIPSLWRSGREEQGLVPPEIPGGPDEIGHQKAEGGGQRFAGQRWRGLGPGDQIGRSDGLGVRWRVPKNQHFQKLAYSSWADLVKYVERSLSKRPLCSSNPWRGTSHSYLEEPHASRFSPAGF